MKQLKHWQDAANAVIGAWLVLSPWALGFAGVHVAMANMVIAGLVGAGGLAIGAIWVPRLWEEWTEAIVALWLIASPWLLSFSTVRDAMADAVATGIVVLVLALWALASDPDARQRVHATKPN